jgi:hypothetical protein
VLLVVNLFRPWRQFIPAAFLLPFTFLLLPLLILPQSLWRRRAKKLTISEKKSKIIPAGDDLRQLPAEGVEKVSG